jgi:acyl-CoA reductase-like NAD-dependent aldehyde dehydrogenase
MSEVKERRRMAVTSDMAIPLHPKVSRFVASPKQMLVGGEWVDAIDGGTFPTVDPATGGTITEVAEAKAADIDRAVKAAQRALEGEWSRISPSDRALLLLRLADLIGENADEIAQLESLDNGKPLSNAQTVDVPRVQDHFRYFAGWCTKIYGDQIPVSTDMLVYTRREPIGVVGAIIPWNFPISMASWKLAPALAAGCTVILKPAEQTPLSAIRLGELIEASGFPPGVVNVCPGYGPTAGEALVSHPGVATITFTGSVEVGRRIAAVAAPTLKQVSLELGGKSPNIIFGDAHDLPHAIRESAAAIFYESGQVCCAGSRLMVQSSVFDDVVDGMSAQAQSMKIGPGLAEGTTLGPLVSDRQLERVLGYLEGGQADGARAVVGGGRAADGQLANGYFVEPTVLVDVDDNMTIAREEIFGPAVVVQPFETLDEVAARANASEYGLSAGIWTSDLSKAHRLAAALKVGTAWNNCYGYVDVTVPWGGFKSSGAGRGKDCGLESLEKFLQTKVVWTQLT